MGQQSSNTKHLCLKKTFKCIISCPFGFQTIELENWTSLLRCVLQIKRRRGRRTPTRRSLQTLKEEEEKVYCGPEAWIPSSTPPLTATWPLSATHWQPIPSYQVGESTFCVKHNMDQRPKTLTSFPSFWKDEIPLQGSTVTLSLLLVKRAGC